MRGPQPAGGAAPGPLRFACGGGHAKAPESGKQQSAETECSDVTAAQSAEDRGFEPRRVLPPNRISGAPVPVPLRSAYRRESAEPQATGTGNLSDLPGRAGFSPGVRACLVRAPGSPACPRREHVPVMEPGPAWRRLRLAGPRTHPAHDRTGTVDTSLTATAGPPAARSLREIWWRSLGLRHAASTAPISVRMTLAELPGASCPLPERRAGAG